MQAELNPCPPILKVNFGGDGPVRQRLMPAVSGALERVLHFDQLNALYYKTLLLQDERDFPEKLLDALQVRYEVSPCDLARIPVDGPVVVTANHPFGAIEGIILATVLRSVRPDVKIMANFLLGSIPELRDLFILVDPFAGQASTFTNVRALRETLGWLRRGAMLAVFPAGEVSHIDLASRRVTDPEWSGSIARIIRASGARALPVCFGGSNGLAFQVLGLVHPRLRTALLPHEFLNKRDKTISLRIGNPIPFERLAAFASDDQLMTYLRHRTYALACNETPPRPPIQLRLRRRVRQAGDQPIAPPVPSQDLSREIQSLPLEQRLVTSGEFTVYQARAGEIPRTLQEIGRLREISFRAAGEGSGKACDLDEFDCSYIHLFIWNHSAGELVGAYRLGPTDEILPASGLSGLYTSTLFNFAPGFQRQITCALEMGRSFVRPEYQRSLGALPVLWKGISKFVLENPRYRILFGAVSISSRYGHFSRDLMVAFLRSHHYLSSLSGMVKARSPFRPTGQKALAQQTLELVGNNLDELSTIISDIESNGAGVPILLKHYLKLGGRILGFNVDPNFSHVVDGLILVDLLQTEPRFLQRYMGKDQADAYLASWLPAGDSPQLAAA
jgi:putative hemolysin